MSDGIPRWAISVALTIGLSCVTCPARAQADAASSEAEPEVVEVTIVGRQAPLKHARRAPTVASTVIEGEDLHEAGTSSTDVLARVPGVQVTRTGAQSDVATASIRGADAEQVPVYLAGIRLNDDVSGTADLSTVPMWMIERVEVFRGNAPDGADRLGIGGAIFFWPRVPRETRFRMGGELGSFGQHEGWVSSELGTRRAASLVALRRSGADNDYLFVDDQGQRFDLVEREVARQNADFGQTDAWAISRYELAAGARIHTVLHALDREQGVTGLSVVPARDARARTRRFLVGSSLSLPCSSQDYCRLELSSSLLTADSTLTDPFVELPALRTRLLDNHGERVSHSGRLEVSAHRDLVLGLNATLAFENARIDRIANLPRRGNRRSLVPSASAKWQLLSPLALHVLAGMECHSTRGVSVRFSSSVFTDDGTCGVAEPVGRVGLQYRLSEDVELLSNVARYVRVPTLSELYGTAPLVEGNAELRPEQGWSVDAGVRWTRPARGHDDVALSVDAFAFARQVDDLIRYRRSSVEAVAPFNVAEARLLGAELAAGADLYDHVRIELAGTALDPRETTDDPALDPTTNDILTHTARSTWSSLVQLYTEPAFQALDMDRASLGVRYYHKSSRFDDPAGQNVLPEQNFVDVELAARFVDSHLLVRLAARNVFDVRTADIIGLPVPGRSYHAAAEAWF